VVKIRAEDFWVVKPCSVVVVYQCFGSPCCIHVEGEVTESLKELLHPEDGGSMVLRNVGILHTTWRHNQGHLDLKVMVQFYAFVYMWGIR
jgi:hypothetical protein